MTIDANSSVKPDDIMDKLAEYNIESRPIWKPMHMQPVFAEYAMVTADGSDGKNGSVCQSIFERGLCLPSDIKNTEEDMDLIISLVRGCF
ncbi:MAG: DegT/DnrJ/EryC1/StrS family aminotransferase, partial [Lachnospiraceae bacterium]|nr:DegT/DnrJ/EryC1/StrS family aminotransferase [Candidatus Merdinaster equi]